MKYKHSMLKSSIYNYNDADTYILAKGTITVQNTTATATSAKNDDKKVMLEIVLLLLIT